MSIRDRIQSIFNDRAFERPLFYAYEDGLRFELSEGGHFLTQFLTAHRKALEICEHLFNGSESIQVCLKVGGEKSLLSVLSTIKALKIAGVYSNTTKEHWTEFDPEWEGDEDYENSLWHYIAFNISKNDLSNVLWCALATDFGYIEPNPSAIMYLFDLDREIMVFPYDDRGMDVIGNNKPILLNLYNTFNHYLLEYDKEAMDAAFRIAL
ncbi:DUF3885 domain-containing protein [Shewanella inventionis]|uniref:DUF3885 domain-containing protein n=1 Tax=Shewanella inventionis TaxID=1738770 RepID=A0ABQ1JX34_9GAMM|nr:DUF3885 domain-containing protein [Shewanella inventionis]MCL1160221.1 DUF3885 domain-containing protein [Shewanella inventionis]UAL43076.1 DUF3885 domain-containing protein [Shewanella inventionis]GGB77967.1 hypothetical protein GCM10011607_42600 [Shewanella inventionis]